MGGNGTVVLSTLEFDVAWESARLPPRHVAIDVPSPGMTHTERARLVGQAWESLADKGLATAGRVSSELADRLALLATPMLCIDAWVWADREVKALAALTGREALLAVVDGEGVWLIPARDTALAEAAVSVAGATMAGPGRSVSLPAEVLRAADEAAQGDPHQMIMALERRGVGLSEAQMLVGMLAGMGTRGQFGVERRGRDRRMVRADRVVAFHDTDAGRYLYLARPSTDGRLWGTVTPADNQRIVSSVEELVHEV